jgi:hypothetical protein
MQARNGEQVAGPRGHQRLARGLVEAAPKAERDRGQHGGCAGIIHRGCDPGRTAAAQVEQPVGLLGQALCAGRAIRVAGCSDALA